MSLCNRGGYSIEAVEVAPPLLLEAKEIVNSKYKLLLSCKC